jgi:hypothetical protein
MKTDSLKSQLISNLDILENLLKKQIELAQQGNISDVEHLRSQADALVEKIVQEGSLESPEFQNRRKKLKKLYGNLCLALTAAKADTSAKIDQVRKGRKTIKAYRSNI